MYHSKWIKENLMLHMHDLYGILSISAASILFCNINCEESSVKVPSYPKTGYKGIMYFIKIISFMLEKIPNFNIFTKYSMLNLTCRLSYCLVKLKALIIKYYELFFYYTKFFYPTLYWYAAHSNADVFRKDIFAILI